MPPSNSSAARLRLEVDERLVVFAAAYNEAAGEQGVEELIAGGGDFTAVVCGNDRLAVGAIAALARLKLKCPEDISVTGYNDMSMMDRIDPPLTHRAHPAVQDGARSRRHVAEDDRRANPGAAHRSSRRAHDPWLDRGAARG